MTLLYTNDKDEDLVNMLAAEVHVGTNNCTKMMEGYVFRRNKEGIFYINLSKTWEKLMVAARIVAAVQSKNPKDVLVSDLFLKRRTQCGHPTFTSSVFSGVKETDLARSCTVASPF